MTEWASLPELEAQVCRRPDDNEVRVLLAERLLAADRAGDALDHARRVLAAQPVHLAALVVAAEAAGATGLADLAVGYRRLLAALGHPGHGTVPGSLYAREAPIAAPEPAPMVAEEIDDLHDLHDLVERPSVTLDDVAGLADVKRRLDATFLSPLRNPEIRQAFGASLRGGLLLYGPPGCGKTFIARALAGELRAGFITIKLTDVLDPYFGVAERRLHDHFEAARRWGPCIVFIDEVDAIGRKRSQLRGDPGRRVVTQLLTELDSIEDRNDGVFVLAATNHPWDLDTALRRPGRFDRSLLVLPPDAVAREAILALHLRGRPTADLDLRKMAAATAHFSGADLAHLCQTATELAMERSVRSGRVDPVTQRDLQRACAEIRPSTGPWLDVARNYALYANDSGQYDELAAYLRSRRIL